MGSNQYHLHIATLSRKSTKKYPNGRTSVQMAAYISGSKLHDDRRNKTYNSTYKSEVTNSELILPWCAPKELLNELEQAKANKDTMRSFREKFWNGVETHFKASNAQVGKTIDIAYPIEFGEYERKQTRDEFVKIFTDNGYAVDVADHLKEKNNNPHFHMQIAPSKMHETNTWVAYKEIKGYSCTNSKGDTKVFRNTKAIEGYNAYHKDDFHRIPIIDEATGEQKLGRRNEKLWKREKMQDNPLNNRESLKRWREQWEAIANKYLPKDRQISCKSYKARGINKKPSIHLGGKANRIKENSYRYQQNEAIKALNATNNLDPENVLNMLDDILHEDKHSHFGGVGAIANEREREAMRGIYGDDETTDKEI